MRKILLISSLLLLFLQQGVAQNPFITSWSTSTDSQSISIPLNNSFSYDFNFTWRNSSDSSEVTSGTHVSADGNFETELPVAGNYFLEITGTFPHFQGYPTNRLTDVNQWGDIDWQSFSQTFRNWTGVNFSAEDVPDLSNVTTTFQMFFDARTFNSDVSDWEMGNVQDIGDMFRGARAFNSDLSGWDISSATRISQMFAGAQNFNSDISGWQINENATTLTGMFRGASRFNADLNGWNVSNITNMFEMFRDAQDFNQDLNDWNVSAVTNMRGMFRDAEDFNGNIANWNVSTVVNMRDMFLNADVFNVNLNAWNVENVTDMEGMFANALAFNSDLNDWNVSNVRSMRAMFRNARAFNGNISDWNVEMVTNMGDMFRETRSFNQDIGRWNVSNVTSMALMFRGANANIKTVFNQDISNWDVRRVANMTDMFLDSRFNQDIGNWTIEATTNMRRMFFRASEFNQDISSWNVSGVENMGEMFEGATTFNQNLGTWDISSVNNMQDMFNGTSLSPQNYDQILIGWATRVDDTTPDVNFGASGLTFCLGATARQSLIDNGWTINDANTEVCLDETDFVSFEIPQFQATESVINTTDHTVTLSVILSADITSLIPVFELSPGATAIPASNEVQDFTAPVVYTVTAEDGVATQDWTVTIVNEIVALTDTEILTFELTEDSPGLDQVVSINLDELNQTITLDLIPFGSLAEVIPEITLSQGATISPTSGTAIDLSSGSFIYTVIAEDGTTAQDWSVNTNVLPSDETDITAFTIADQIGETVINSIAHEITLTYPFAAGITDLVPVIELSQAATIDPLSDESRDFTVSGTNSVEYTVTAQDGITTQLWTITLIPASEETDILGFTVFNDLIDDTGIDADNHTVLLTLLPFTELAIINPEIIVSDRAIVSPGSDEEVVFNNGPITYTVTAENGITTQDWTINSLVLPSTLTDILSFEIPGQVGESFIDSQNRRITVFFNSGTDLTALSPSFEVSRAANAVSESDIVQDFSADVTYTVTAQDGVTTSDWIVSAIQQRPFITSWTSNGGNLTISLNERENYNFNFIWRNSNGQIVAFGKHDTDEDFVTDLPAGEYTLEIIGTFPHFTGFPRNQLLDVNQWGDIIWESMRESFRNWTGTDFSASDTPDLSQGPDMFRAFSDNPNFNADLSDWDMSQVRTLQGLFNTCPSFNSDISQWNVSNVTNMESVFINSGFNGDLSEWDVSNVTRMVNTFRDASNFDQNLSNWIIGNVNNMSDMLTNSGMSVQNYDRFLISAANQSVQNNVTLGADGLNRCLGSEARTQLIDEIGWAIQDDGQLCSSENDILTFNIQDVQVNDAVIDVVAHTVDVNVLSSADLTNLTANLTISEGASVIPGSGSLLDFTAPVTYEVIATDGTTQEWTVNVSNLSAASMEAEILSFDANSDQVATTTIDEATQTIMLELISGGTIGTITPEFTLSLGASANPSSGESIDLSSRTAIYTVIAEDGITTLDWTIAVLQNSNTDILNFELTTISFSNIQIDSDNHEVNVVVGDDSDITSVLTEITLPIGASIAPQAVAVQDFTNPVVYTVTATDGFTTQDWLVSVTTMRPFITTWNNSDLDITINNDFTNNFSFQIKDENGEVRQTGNRVNGDGVIDANFDVDTLTVEIIGDFPHFTGFEPENLVDVNQWGDIVWQSFEGSFQSWTGEAFSAVDQPDLSQVTNMSNAFGGASLFNGDLSQWDVSNVTDMNRMFLNATSFNGDLSNWITSNVTDMSFMFAAAESFNGDVTTWDVSNVTNMNRLFNLATAFNRDVSEWNVGQVMDMFRMFRNTSFNQDIGGWSITSVTDMGEMFNGSALSSQFYERILTGWATQDVQTGVTLGASGIDFCSSVAVAARERLETEFDWEVIDEGLNCSSENDILAIDLPTVQLGNEIIDAVAHTVQVTVISSADLTALSPTFTLSDGAIFSTNSPQSGDLVDFSQSEINPVTYEVLSSDSTFQTWSVTVVNSAVPLTETDILTFDPGVGNSVTIDTDLHEITFDAAITEEFVISPELTLSQGATSSPTSGDEIDLTDGSEIYTVTAEDGTTTQDWTLTVNDLLPVNDFCSNAIAVAVDEVVMGNTTFATSDANIAPDCGSNNTGLGVWYRIVGNGETITLNTCSPNSFSDTSLSLFTGSCTEGLICEAGNDDAGIPGECGGAGFQSRLGFNSILDVEYFILVDGFESATGGFELSITSEPTPELPENEDCETAELLSVFAQGTGTPTEGNNTSAALFVGEVECDNFGAINDVWYTFNSGPNVTVGVTLTGEDTDGEGPFNAASGFRLAAYDECGGNSIICDTNADGLTNLNVQPNTDYWLQVWNDDVEDEGTFTIIVNDGPNNPAVLFFENSPNNESLISRFTESNSLVSVLNVSDQEGHEQIVAITSGNEEGIFAFNDATNEITVANETALQASVNSFFNLTFQAADQGPGDLTADITLTVNISDNAAPQIVETTFATDENTVSGTVIGSLNFSDMDGDAVSIVSFSTNDGAFSVNPNNGEIQVANESLLNFERNGSLSLSITIEDDAVPSLQTSETIVININDVNEAPIVDVSSFIISDQSLEGTVIGLVSFDEEDANQLHTYEIIDSDANDIFVIDANSGEISIDNSILLTDNGAGTYHVVVEVSDNGSPVLSGSNTVTIEVTTNNAPEINTDMLTLDENSPVGTLIGNIEVSDADGDQITLSFVNSILADDFLLSQDGQLFVGEGASLNFENTPQIDLEIAATDNGAGNLQTVQTVIIVLNDVNEAPVLAARSINIAVSILDNTELLTIQGEDPENDALIYQITAGNEVGVFGINESTGVLFIADASLLEPISTPSYTLTVSATDGEFSAEAQITINVFNNADSPIFTSENTFTIDENNGSEALIGTVVATDSDGISDYDIISGNDNGLFTISTTGELSANGVVFNFEETQEYVLEVRAEDDGLGNVSSTQQITINVNDVNEFDPVITGVSGTIAENSDAGIEVATVEASDADTFQTLSYEITEGNEVGNFAIDENGVITTLAAIDFELAPIINLMVAVSDDVAPIRTSSQEVVITVTDVNETPILTAIADQNGSVGGQITFTVETTDPENDDLIFSFAENSAQEGMEINATTGVFTWTPTIGQFGAFESTVEVTDGEFTVSENVSFTILNSETDILTFEFAEQTREAVINRNEHIVSVEVTRGTDLTVLIPTITVSERASISLGSGVAADFTDVVTYTVTAENTDTQEWTITVTETPNAETDILTFVLAEQTGEAVISVTDHTVEVEVALGTNVSALTPTLTLSEGASSNPENGTAADFSQPVTYTVTAEDETTTQDWVVNVTIRETPLNEETDILTFEFAEQTRDAIINTVDHTVSIEVFFGTDVTALIPTFTLSEGATSNPASGVSIDFTSPTGIVVTAEDGITTQEWTITVTIEEVITSVEEEIKLETYPNPASELLVVKSKEAITAFLIDLNGKAVSQKQTGKDLRFTMSDLGIGTYLLIIENGEKRIQKKIIKN